MPKERTDPVRIVDDGRIADNEYTEEHPAFCVVSVHRITSSPGEILFQSDIRHSHYIRIEVHEVTRNRHLKGDWLFPRRKLIEFSMSEAQFASFVASGGTSGIPATLEFVSTGKFGAGDRPGLHYQPRLQVNHEELQRAANETYEHVRKAFKEYEEALAMTGKGTAAAQKRALFHLKSALDNTAPNVVFAAQRLEEHAEQVVEMSRADIEAIAVRAAEASGIPVSQLLAIEGTGEAPEE